MAKRRHLRLRRRAYRARRSPRLPDRRGRSDAFAVLFPAHPGRMAPGNERCLGRRRADDLGLAQRDARQRATFANPQIVAFNAGLAAVGFLTLALIMVKPVQARERERALGRSDPLTGLANRRALSEIAAQQLALCARQARPVSLAYFDLDAFKSANDRLGHDWGDSLLRSFGRLMTKNIRASDTAARVGGDEFVIFLPETEQDVARSLTSRLRDLIDEDPDFRHSGVTVSGGVVSESPAKSDLPTLLRRADAAMCQAKLRRKTAAARYVWT
ncbi:MAG: GGDEF domain-containing protein [Burkholderiaceae bacterium]